MRNVCLLSLIMAFAVNSYSQTFISKKYYVVLNDNDVDCGIEFFSDGGYQISIGYFETEDIIAEFPISQGLYRMHDSIIYMNDLLCGYDMTFINSGNEIYPIKTFGFIKKNKIVYDGKCDGCFSDVWSEKSNTVYHNQGNIKINGFKKKSVVQTLKTGTYWGNDSSRYGDMYGIGGYYFTITEDGCYVLKFKDLVLSHGIWSYIDNRLKLNDIDLYHGFEMIIGDGELITGDIPGEYGYVLKYATPEELKREMEEKEKRRELLKNIPSVWKTESVDGDSDIFQITDKMPEFIGGNEKLLEFIGNNTIYPDEARENNIHGKVFIGFVVERDGSLSNIKVLRGIGYGCDEEACRVVSMMPKWKPGKHKGELVRVRYLVPVVF